MTRTYLKDIDRAKQILNHAILELYGIKDLTSYQIVFLLELYANNEKEQIKSDLEVE